MIVDSSFFRRSIQDQHNERRRLLCVLLIALAVPAASAQNAGKPYQESHSELRSQMAAMQTQLESAQRQIAEDHQQLIEMREEIAALTRRTSPAADAAHPAVASAGTIVDLQRAVADLEERQAISQSEIQVHEQEKVESTSKYSVRLHGLVLFNSSVNNGSVDEPTAPTIAIPKNDTSTDGSLTATGHQTLIGLNSVGPSIWGAHTYAGLEMDFSGAATTGSYSSGSNLIRLRTADMQFAWPTTEVRGGISPLILTPYYATSYFSIAEPAMSWSGALWGWLPQLSVEQRLNISETHHLAFQAALVDVPDPGISSTNSLGEVSAAERSRNPGAEFRTSWQSSARLPASFGIGGYWSPHSYSASTSLVGGTFDAWAVTADWKIQLPSRLQVSGALYDGAALGGLSAGTFKDSVEFYGESSLSHISKLSALRDAGGWTQLKFRPTERLEFNVAFGQDNGNSGQLRAASGDAHMVATNPYAGLARNQTAFGNLIFRPTSAIILSGEYRKIRSWQVTGPSDGASLFGLAAGYEF
jgi:hypothetical protein